MYHKFLPCCSYELLRFDRMKTIDLSNPKPAHTTGGSGRVARRGGGAEARTSETSEMLCKPNAGTKSAVDKRFVSDLSPGRDALFVARCTLVDRRLFVSVNPFHARHVWEYILHEKSLKEQIDIGTLVSSQEQKERFSPLLQTAGIPLVKAGFVPLTVYIGFSLFVLAKSCSRQLLSSLP